MKRVNVDTESLAVKRFIRSLAVDASGVEITLDGTVVCKVIPPGQLSDREKSVQLAKVRELLGAAREHSKRVPATVIERKIRNAIKTVREKR